MMQDEEIRQLVALLSAKLDAIIERLPPPPRPLPPLPPARVISDEEHSRLSAERLARETESYLSRCRY